MRRRLYRPVCGVTAKRPDHVWRVELTTVPTVVGVVENLTLSPALEPAVHPSWIAMDRVLASMPPADTMAELRLLVY